MKVTTTKSNSPLRLFWGLFSCFRALKKYIPLEQRSCFIITQKAYDSVYLCTVQVKESNTILLHKVYMKICLKNGNHASRTVCYLYVPHTGWPGSCSLLCVFGAGHFILQIGLELWNTFSAPLKLTSLFFALAHTWPS